MDGKSLVSEQETETEIALRSREAMLERLNRVYYRVRSANVEMCGADTTYLLGFTPLSLDEVPNRLRSAYRKVYGLDDKARVVSVIPGGPADRAGVRPGDELVSVDGRAAPRQVALGVWMHQIVLRSRNTLPIPVVVRRGDREVTLPVTAQRVCRYAMRLSDDDRVNAHANPRRIVVTTGLMRFVRSDDELALVLGHEMAHDTMHHMARSGGGGWQGRVWAPIAGALSDLMTATTGEKERLVPTSRQLEQEADYVGTYYAARAGYDVSKVADFWRRRAAAQPYGIYYSGSHPSSAERYVAIEKTAREISRKEAAGERLLPDPSENAAD